MCTLSWSQIFSCLCNINICYLNMSVGSVTFRSHQTSYHPHNLIFSLTLTNLIIAPSQYISLTQKFISTFLKILSMTLTKHNSLAKPLKYSFHSKDWIIKWWITFEKSKCDLSFEDPVFGVKWIFEGFCNRMVFGQSHWWNFERDSVDMDLCVREI